MHVSRPTVRRKILVRSAQRLLDADGSSATVHDVIMLWTRHRWSIPYMIMCGILLYGVATVTGVEAVATRVVIAGCAVAVAAMATTNYWALAATSDGLVLCRSSRIRQYATKIERWLEPDAEVEMRGSTVVTSDWRIDGTDYTVTKRAEASLRQLSLAD